MYQTNSQLNRTSASLIGKLLLFVTFSVTQVANAYEYPFVDPFMATVAGTPAPLQGVLPEKVKFRVRKLAAIEGRDIPDALWYGRRLEYSYAKQKKAAPLVFAIAGTGGYHNSGLNKDLMRAIHAGGAHVVGISSPSHPKFVIAASGRKVPGHLRYDAEDIYQVMQRIMRDLEGKLEVTEFYLTGYSLGGTHAAFVAKIDSEQRVFDFKKVLLINPPVSLYNSIAQLDRMLQNIPGGVDNFNKFFATVVQQISNAYTRSTTVEFNQDLVYAAFKADPPTDEELAALIGAAFRISAANMIFTADVMTDFGFIKPKEVVLKKRTSFADYLQVALRVGFTDYFHEFFWPYYESESDISRQEFANQQSLHPLRTFLKNSEFIHVVHNRDDIILAPGEIDFIAKTFGSRAMIYPLGGHLGNTLQVETLGHIVNTLQP